MKRIIHLLGIGIIILAFASCQKEAFRDTTVSSHRLPVTQQSSFMCGTREGDFASRTAGFCSQGATLMLDFDGQKNVSGTPWGISSAFNCPSPNLTTAMKNEIIARVAEDFSAFNVAIVKDESVFQQASGLKMRMIVTTNMSVYFPGYTGLSFVSSLLWNNGTPSFAFVDMIGSDAKRIAEVCSHELGHTFGLYHHDYYLDCTYMGGILPGNGDGVLGIASIMGNSYSHNLTTFNVGKTSQFDPGAHPCPVIQDDAAIIAGVVGYKADDFSDVLSSTTKSIGTTVTNGILELSNDKDAFLKTTTGTKTITLASKGNIDLALEVYDSPTGIPIVYDDPASTDVTVTITGKKWCRVRMSSNHPFTQFDGSDNLSSSGGGYSIKTN